VLAYVARFFFVPWHLSVAALDQIDESVTEAARMDGADGPRLLWHVTLPLIAPALIAGWIVLFLLSVGEMSMSVLVQRPGQGLLSVALLNLMHYGRDDTLSACCLALMLLVLACSAAAVWMLSRATAGRR
jgi:iron(III) transport system permease protein